MARLIDGINGAFRGKVGSIVGYTLNGQGIIRGLPRKSSKGPSQKQLNNRQAWADAQAWLKFITPFVRIGFKNYSSKQHGFGNALSYLKLNAITEDFKLDTSRALITWGDLAEPQAAAVSSPKPGILEFTWQPERGSDDHAIVLAYSYGECIYGDVCGARRSEGRHVLECEGLSGKEADIYIGFITEERDRCSNSVYLGRVKIM